MSEEQDTREQTPDAEQTAGKGAVEDTTAPAKSAAAAAASSVQPVAFGQLEAGEKGGESRNLDLLLDVEIPISVEVGRTSMCLEDVLKLVPGSVVGLAKKVEEPVDLRVNGKLVARGEVVLVDDSYGLRITQILDAAARLESLR